MFGAARTALTARNSLGNSSDHTRTALKCPACLGVRGPLPTQTVRLISARAAVTSTGGFGRGSACLGGLGSC